MESMPRDIRRYIYLQILALVFSTLPTFALNIHEGSAATRLKSEVVSVLLTTAVFVLLLWLVAWRRQNWARWLCLVLYIISIPLTFLVSPYESPLMQVFNWASVAAAGISYVFLFSNNSRPWFGERLERAKTSRP